MKKFTKSGFTLGQQFTIDNDNLLIVGFEKYFIILSKIRETPNGDIFLVQPNVYVTADNLLSYHEAYVSGFGTGGLSTKLPAKYQRCNNPFSPDSHEFRNWNYGFDHGVLNEQNKS